jgi:hypothetical protein
MEDAIVFIALSLLSDPQAFRLGSSLIRGIMSFTGFPDSILTVLVITRLTTSQLGKRARCTRLQSASGLSAGRPITVTVDPLT